MSRKRIDPCTPASVWTSQELLDGSVARTLATVLRTRGCAWAKRAGCTMCGYGAESCEGVGLDELDAQLAHVLQRYKGEEVVKLYTSGSFLDISEVPEPGRLLEKVIRAGAKRVVVESRPEYIAPSLETIAWYKARIEVALGLETSSDLVRERSVCKGFTFEDYRRAAEDVQAAGARVRTYLLLKPPFLTERDALADCVRSVHDAAPYSHMISINPVNVQRGTLVEKLWRRGAYRTPWLWTLLEALREGRAELPGDVLLVSEPSGGGTHRGVHNCMRCDQRVLDAVRHFSLSQGLDALRAEPCECIETWQDMLDIEPAALTTTDLLRAEHGTEDCR